ncbi:MAG: HIT family protein [Candidatus Lokiarchaeota archaeon]|nr:HIT family protein [Candidatus Lokiarchaeota archaeon]
MNDENCIFCKIIKKEIPSKIIFEDDKTLAFLDINPISEGHAIVIPKDHYETLEFLPDNELKCLYQTVKKVAKLIYEKLNPDGYNIIQNNYKAAGQVIDHFHVHIIPRESGDKKITLALPRSSASNEILTSVMEKIKS